MNLAEITAWNLPIAPRYLTSEGKRHKYLQVKSLGSDNHAHESINHDEIIALFKRIQESISEESPAVSTRKSPKRSKLKKSNKSALVNLQKQEQMEATGETDEEEEETEVDKVKSIKRSPVQTPNAEKAIQEQTHEYSANANLEMQQLTRMKVAELKVLARTQGIKGYSKLKKAELLELLKEVEKPS